MHVHLTLKFSKGVRAEESNSDLPSYTYSPTLSQIKNLEQYRELIRDTEAEWRHGQNRNPCGLQMAQQENGDDSKRKNGRSITLKF